MVDVEQLAAIQATPSEVVWTDHRYGATYLVDRTHLLQLVEAGRVPVLHLGRPAAVDAVIRGLPNLTWLVVELHCPSEVAVERIVDRATGDTSERIAAYDSTLRLLHADVRIDTSVVDVDEAANMIAIAALVPHT